MSSDTKQSDQYKGWLNKWTNYIKGYQKRWFVLQNGLLSYYRNQAEMGHTCRGTINLANAFIHTEDSCSFVISNGGTQTFHLRASSEVERQKWVTALELSKSIAINIMESDEDGDDEHIPPDKNEVMTQLRMLNAKLNDLSTCNDLITKQGAALQRALNEIDQAASGGISGSASSNQVSASTINGAMPGGGAGSGGVGGGVAVGASGGAGGGVGGAAGGLAADKRTAINERTTLFRIACNAMINACAEYLDVAQNQGKRWHRLLHHEHEQRLRLEEMVEQLAKQHSNFEKQARKSLAKANTNKQGSAAGSDGNEDDDDDDFYDAIDTDQFKVCLPKDKGHSGQSRTNQLRREGSGVSLDSLQAQLRNPQGDNWDSSDSESERADEAQVISSKRTSRHSRQSSGASLQSSSNVAGGASGSSLVPANNMPKRRRRTTIPEKPNYSLNLWSIMKNCIGKELSKIPMPVNFSEPISFLQRLTEDFEYSHCLDAAARCTDSCEQLAYVAAFTVSSYATVTNRSSKPFNPLLGETYEHDRREDMGWRSIAEQVSHHPPTVAMHTESDRGWKSWQEFTMSSKFRGKYLQIIPLGIAHLEFPRDGNHYTWRKVTTTVHNIIVGSLWVDNHGEMDITNHHNGDTCHLKYSAYSYFARDVPRKVTGVITDKSGTARWVIQGTWSDKIEGAQVINTIESKNGKKVYETGPQKVLWQRVYPREDRKNRYNFTDLAIQLNEMEEGVAPTDSRHRPDQRYMEEGMWDEANTTKVALEEKQRAARRKREADAAEAAAQGKEYPSYEPLWFKKDTDPQSGGVLHVYTNEYWQCKQKQDWQRCPDIYL